MRTAIACCVALALGWVPSRSAADTESVGTAQNGRLVNGFRIPLTGAFHRFYGPVRSRGTHYATLEMAALLARVARVVDDAAPGAPLVIADCSDQDGGRLGRHRSHTSGRDVDVLFYVRDGLGRPMTARGFDTFDGNGRCTRPGCELVFDVQRNWWAVRTLVMSERPVVQYVFVSDPLKALMLEYAERRGEHREVVRRARAVLLQPADSSPHADHFHVRVYCSPADRARGCMDGGPVWSWAAKPEGMQ